VNIRDWRAGIAADVGLGAVLCAALAVTALALVASWGGYYWLFDSAAGGVVCALALLRRRHRAWTAIAGLVVATVTIAIARVAELPHEPGPAMALALSVLAGSAVRTLPVRAAVATAAGGLAVVVGTVLASLSSTFAIAVMNGAGWLGAVAVGLCLRLLDARRRSTVDHVRRDERLELARELHDVVAHHITGIIVQAQAAQLIAAKHPERIDGSLAGIEEASSDALAAMRRVVGLLRDTEDAVPVTPRLEQLSELVKRFDGHGAAVRLRLPDVESVWPPEVTSTIYRVVQESLTNISRHAPHARSVTVSVAQDRGAVTVDVVDDAPLSPARHHRSGYGLVGMRERVEALGGTLRAGARPGVGWSVLATLPVPVREPR
jgi:signal transduction histidine kinase